MTHSYHKNYLPSFNGKEKDDELYGSGNALDFGARVYDSRLGRWCSIDPLQGEFPEESGYNSFSNNPIFYVDPNGKAVKPANREASIAIMNLVNTLGGDNFFGISEGENGILTTNLNKSLRKFRKDAKKSGLDGDDLESAVALFKLLDADDIYEVAVITSESEAYVKSRFKVSTINQNIYSLMDDIHVDKNLTPEETQEQLDKHLPKGDFYSTNDNMSFAFFPEEYNTEIDWKFSSNGSVLTKKMAGILVVNPKYQLESASSFSDSAPDASEVERVQNLNHIIVEESTDRVLRSAIQVLAGTIEE